MREEFDISRIVGLTFSETNKCYYAVIRSIVPDTKFTVCFSFCLYGYGFLSRGFTDLREILHGGSATSQTGLLPFWWDSPRDGRVWGVNRCHMAGYASC